MGINLMLEYLYASVAIKSPVGLPNKASFVKFGSSGTLISNLKNLLFFIFPPCLRGDNSCLSWRIWCVYVVGGRSVCPLNPL